jgi:RimJ/RimL family protein N-acetyltransferase
MTSPHSHFAVAETLRDGTAVTIRAVRPDDATRLEAAFAGLDRESVYTRFFVLKKALTPAELARIATIDFVRDVMLVATVGGDEKIVAGATYLGQDDGQPPASAEVAFTVEEDYQGRGLASRLLAHLVAIARANGIRRFVAEVLPENRAMRNVFSRAGLATRERRDSGVVHVEIDL